MKTRTRIATLLVVVIYLFFSSDTGAQNAVMATENAPEATPVAASISDDFLIQLPEKDNKLSAVYLLDVKHLKFKSEEKLMQFCKTFTLDFQTLSGDFKLQQIVLELDHKSIESRGFSKTQVQEHFERIAKRMAFYFQKTNK